MNKKIAFGLLAATLVCLAGSLSAAPDGFFDVPDVKTLPLNVDVLSATVTDGVRVLEFFMDGAPFNGKATRIHGFYARPEKEGRYPAVLDLHGAGLNKLSPATAIAYAGNGFCCLAIDWCGPTPTREPPYSEFDSPGNMQVQVKDANGVPIKRKYTSNPETSAMRNGVLFVRRSVQFLQSRPEVDADRLCIAGASAGAFLTLVSLGHEPAFKAAAVKYGCGFLTMPAYRMGGYVIGMTLCPREEQEAWTAIFDSKHRLNQVKANVLMLSGTDDHFFWMPMVLQTYRAMTNPKQLLMLPNDNHSQVGNWKIPLSHFQSVFGLAPAWPTVQPPTVAMNGATVELSAQVSGSVPIADVSFWVKRMPLADFKFKRQIRTPIGSIEPWREIEASETDGAWRAVLPAPAEGEQIVAYAMVTDANGIQVSSDTLELPEYPQWRADEEP